MPHLPFELVLIYAKQNVLPEPKTQLCLVCVGTLDAFAGHASPQHVVTRYYAGYHAPQALAVCPMYPCWKQDAQLHRKSCTVRILTLSFDRCSNETPAVSKG